jgi:1,4-alpha-glucan branching enzyme
MYEHFGAVVDQNNRVEFKLFFPDDTKDPGQYVRGGLPRINGIEFMPWTSWPGGGFSWGYDPFQFFAVEYRYIHDPANPADKLFRLQQLINQLHARNMHVVMDGVFNHVRTGIDSNHLNEQSAVVENFRLSNQRIDSNWGRTYFRKE